MARKNRTGVDWRSPIEGNLTLTTYNSWKNMRQRCSSDNEQWTKYYREKGIRVCEEWQDSFENFVHDMGFCPKSDWSLDRIDSTKGYTKDNCRWASPLLQALNRNYSDDQGLYKNVGGRWTARMKFGGKYVTLGTHEDKEIARKYREAAEKVVERLIEIGVIE